MVQALGMGEKRRPRTTPKPKEPTKKEVGGECEMAAKNGESLKSGPTVLFCILLP